MTYEITMIPFDGSQPFTRTISGGYEQTYEVTRQFKGCSYRIKFIGKVDKP